MKIAVLAAMSCWAVKSAEAIKSDVISFFVNGLKEKEALRRAHLRCLRNMFKNPDAPVMVVWKLALVFHVFTITAVYNDY